MERQFAYPPIEPMVIIHDDDLYKRSAEKLLQHFKPELSLYSAFTKTKISRCNIQKIEITVPFTPELENPLGKRKSLPLEKCPVCKKYFRRMATHLQKHAEEETRQIPIESLQCKFCQRSFDSALELQIHTRTHTAMRPYVCDVCHKGFTQSCNLTNHMRIHTGERPFKCPHCERAFTQSGNLRNHIRLHLDHKPFKCHFCERAFTQSGNLSSHIKNNHRFD